MYRKMNFKFVTMFGLLLTCSGYSYDYNRTDLIDNILFEAFIAFDNIINRTDLNKQFINDVKNLLIEETKIQPEGFDVAEWIQNITQNILGAITVNVKKTANCDLDFELKHKSGLRRQFCAESLIRERIKITEGCRYKIRSLRRKQPLIFMPKHKKNELRLWYPNSHNLPIFAKYGCSNAKNKLLQIEDDLDFITCQGSDFYPEKLYRPLTRPVQCRKTLSPKLYTTDILCAKKELAAYSKIQFEINKDISVDLFGICFSKYVQETIFTIHEIHGKSLKFRQKPQHYPVLHTSDLLKCQVHSSKLYTKDNQLSAFQTLLGPNQTKLNNEFSLEKSQLVPAADFPLQPMQSATYFLVNALPQWNTINQGSWKILENKIRKYASQNEYVFKVFTGGYGTLSYNDANNDPTKIYLSPEDKCLGVPKYIWKVIYREQTAGAIAFVSVNDPYAKLDDLEDLCPNMCKLTNWNHPKFRNFTSGYIYCCDVDELRKTFAHIPNFDTLPIYQILVYW
ncbi:uncharacterized protein LOC113367646 [Ctenocephalides felis]|uniref:uncharacterized protein LOC113367646 n=1 Tax=Ctenocephalides felis TaxID=7515 RepID=UPI000E6E37B0|nr:uncharacterized protein LOC113367646 [Ctenocephalides felis]